MDPTSKTKQIGNNKLSKCLAFPHPSYAHTMMLHRSFQEQKPPKRCGSFLFKQEFGYGASHQGRSAPRCQWYCPLQRLGFSSFIFICVFACVNQGTLHLANAIKISEISFKSSVVDADQVPSAWKGVTLVILYGGKERKDARAGAALIPLTQNVRNTIWSVGGVRGVSAFPEYRR